MVPGSTPLETDPERPGSWMCEGVGFDKLGAQAAALVPYSLLSGVSAPYTGYLAMKASATSRISGFPLSVVGCGVRPLDRTAAASNGHQTSQALLASVSRP